MTCTHDDCGDVYACACGVYAWRLRCLRVMPTVFMHDGCGVHAWCLQRLNFPYVVHFGATVAEIAANMQHRRSKHFESTDRTNDSIDRTIRSIERFDPSNRIDRSNESIDRSNSSRSNEAIRTDRSNKSELIDRSDPATDMNRDFEIKRTGWYINVTPQSQQETEWHPLISDTFHKNSDLWKSPSSQSSRNH